MKKPKAKPTKARKGEKTLLLSGGNPQIPRAFGVPPRRFTDQAGVFAAAAPEISVPGLATVLGSFASLTPEELHYRMFL